VVHGIRVALGVDAVVVVAVALLVAVGLGVHRRA
jgi:hypothetical protein